jgi:type IV pilus assembly protein PilO
MRLVEPRPEEPQEQYVRLPVALHLSGRYHQLSRFFYNVSRLERAISMENIQLTEPTVTEEDVVLNVQVLATTFRRPGEEDAAPAATGG